ncbi:DUF4368 domain-containing protein [Flavonifractor plautii]|uniref:DUF4368 domain-containing protein n=1 Tax=Flavonifractor plautii TaxID=292800 RepID=UPI003EE83123
MWQYDTINGKFIPGTLPAEGNITACYDRLSQEDELDGDSGSVVNQRDFLRKYCEEHHFQNVRHFSDDGYTGTNFDRPGFREMMDLVERGRVTAIIVKDHSRLGRNRLLVGALMERFTEDYGVRYIAVTDNIDSAKGLDDMTAVRELFNEFYPRDTSKKIRAVFNSKGNSGQRLCTQVPYGYKGDKYKWEVDEEAAQVVREIFSLCMAGLGPMQISKRLKAAGVLTPTAYKLEKGLSVTHKSTADPCGWDHRAVVKILERMEYLGCTVNFKTRKKLYKSKKMLYLPPEEWKVFPDTHPAIIDRETWERVQELRKHKRRPTKAGKRGLFSGLAYCADCMSKLYFATHKGSTEDQDHYVCSNYKSNTGSCTIHYIREKVLTALVLAHLQATIAYVQADEDGFIRLVMDKDAQEQRRELARKKAELTKAEKRVTELDSLFQRVYEDHVTGKLTEERYNRLSGSYEAEQRELEARVAELRRELEKGQEEAVNVSHFVELVRKYTEVRELTPTIVNEFIKMVIVHAPSKVNGKRFQPVQIVYNLVGEITIPGTMDSKTA